MSFSSYLQTVPPLETERLVLRQLEKEDAKDIFLSKKYRDILALRQVGSILISFDFLI